MRPRGTTDVYYPEAMRHIVRKRTAANKTVSQNNADILSWSAGWLLQFFSLISGKEGGYSFLFPFWEKLSVHKNGIFSLLSSSLCLFVSPSLASAMYLGHNEYSQMSLTLISTVGKNTPQKALHCYSFQIWIAVISRKWQYKLSVWLMLKFMEHPVTLLKDTKRNDCFLSPCRTNLHGEAPLQGLEGARWPAECQRTTGGGQR